MLSLYFVYLDMGLDTRVFVCICLLATLHTHSTRGYSLYSHLLYRACCNACNDRCGSRRTNGQQRLGHDLVLGLAGGNGAPPGAVGVGVGHWRHGGPLMSNMSTSPGVYYEGGDKDRSVYLAVYLVRICFQDKNTQIHAYLHPSPCVFPT